MKKQSQEEIDKKIFLKYAYPLGDAAYNGNWDKYWLLHKEMRKECWGFVPRIFFRIGTIVAFLKGDKWKP